MTFFKYAGFGAFPGNAGGNFGGVDLVTAADVAVQMIAGATTGRIRIDSVSASGLIWNGGTPTTQLAPLYMPLAIITAKVGPGAALDAFLSQFIVGGVVQIPPSLATVQAAGGRLRWQQQVGTGFPNFGAHYNFGKRSLYADPGETVFVFAGCMGNVTGARADARTLAYLSVLGDYESGDIDMTLR